MSQAYKCDVCGAVEEGEPTGNLSFYASYKENYYFTNQRIQEHHSSELCHRCVDELGRAMQERRKLAKAGDP